MSSNILKKINIEPNKQSQQIQQYQIDFMSQVEDIEQYEEILEQQKLFEVNQNLFQMHLTIDLPNFSIIQQININLEKVQKTLQKLYIYDIQYLIMDSNQEYFTAVIQNEQISKSLEKTLQTQTQSISVVGVTKQIKVLFLYSLIEEFEEVQEIINDSFNSIKSIEIIGYELKSNISGNYQLDIMNIYNSLYKINRIQESVECQIALGISLYNCRKFNQAQEQFEQASNFYLQMHKQSIKYLTNPQIMNQQNQKNKKNGIIYNLLQYQTTNLSIQKINQHYQNFHSKNQYLYKVAKLYLLVAYSISSFSNFDQKIKAYILAANYYIGDFDPEVDQKQLFKNIQIDPYTGLLKIMPILVSLLLKAIEEESEIIRIAGLVGLEYLIENLGCTISQNFIPILKLIINTYPKLLIVKKNTINNQIQTKLFEIHETQESQYMKTGESQQEDLNLKHSSQNQDENNSFQFQSQNEEQENQYENQNQKETQEQIDKNNIKSGNFQNESQNLEIPNQNTNNQTQNLQIIDHYNRILDSFLNLLASTSSNILREIFNDICIENVYKLDIHPNLQIYLLKFMEKIISICQGDLSINSKFIEQYYNFQLENCQNDSILIEQENQQQLKASQINQKSQNLTQINTVLWDKALKEKLIQNLDTKNINNIIEYVILGIQKILSQTNPPKLLIKITVDIIQSICIKSQKKQMILPKNFANYYTTLQTCQQQININLLVEPLINWINQIIQNPENLEQFKKTWETLTLVLSSQTEKQSSNNQNYFSFSLIAISFINTVYNFIQTNPPTLNMLKYLNIILQSPNQTDEDFQYYMQQFLEKFVQHIPHSIFDETFMVFEQIYQQEVEGIQDLQQIQKILELTEKSNNLQEKEQTLKNQQNNQQQNKQSNLNDNNLYQSQEKKNEKQEHEEKNNSNESSLSQQEDHENKQLKNRFSISKNLIASLILNTLNMYLVNLKDPKQQFNALIQLEQLFSTTLGQSEDNFQNYSNPKTQSSHTNIQESLNFDVSSQNTTFDINLIKNQEQQSTKQTQNKQNTENQDNQSLSGQISDKSLSDKELVTPTNKNKNNNYIKKNNQNQNNNSNNNNQNQSLEYNDSQYLQIRLNCIFEFWPIITQFIHSPWSNIRSLAYSLLCNWIRTDIKNYNSNQQQNLLQKLQEVLQILLSSNESESRTGGLNILGSFCGLSQDFSQIKIYNQFQENQDPNIKQKQLLKQQQQQLLITQKDQLFSYFQRNSTFIDQKIWELVFNIQFDWDITNQAAAMAIIQLCAPREFILELFKQKQDIQQQLQQQQQSNQQQIYQQQQQNSQFFQERQTKNQNQSQNQQQYQSQSNSLLFNNFSKKNNEDFVFSFSSSQSSFCKNWNANFQESQIYKEIQKKKQQDQSFKLSKKLTKENNISQTYSFFQNDNTYMQNDLSLSQDIQALKTNINNHLNLSEITPIKFGDNSDLLTSVKKHLMNQNKDNNNNNNNLIYENNNLIIKPNLFKRDQETQEKNTQDSPKNIDASQLQENFQQQQQQQQQLGQQQFFWVENADEKEIKDMINMFKNEFKPPNSLWIEKINYCEDSFEYLGYEQNSEYQIYEENQNLEEDNDQYQTRLETQLLNNFEFEMYVDPQQLDKQQQIKKRRPQTSYKRKEQLELDETDLQEMKNIKNNQNQGQSPTNDEIKNKNISNNYYDDDENINDEDLMDELDIQEINEEDENLIEQQFENAKNLKNQQIIKQEDEKGKQVQTQFKLNLDKIKDNKQNNNQQPQINNQRIMVQDNQTDSDECNSQNSYNSDQQSSEKDKILNENITEQRQKNSQTPQTQQKIQQNQNNQNQQQLLNINSQIIESQNKIKEKQQQQQQQKKENNQDIDDDNVDNESYNDINEDQQSKNSQGEKEDEEDEDEDEEEIEIKNSYNQQINAELHKNLEDSNFSDEEFIQYDLNRNDFNQKQDQNFNSQELIPDQQDNLQDQNFGKDNKEDSVSHQTKEQQLLYLLQQSLPENLQQSLQNNDLKPGELEKLMIQQSKVSQLSIDLQQFNNQEILNASKKFNSNDNFKSNDSNLELQKQLKLLQQINNLQQSYEDSPLIQTKKQIPKAQNIQTPEINKQKTVQKQNQNQSQNLIQSKNQQQEIKPQETEKITQKLQQQEMPQQNQQQQNKQKSKKNNFSSTPDNSKKHYRNKSSDDKDSKKQQKQKGQNVSSFTKHKKTNTLSYNIDPKLLGNTEPILKQENILSNNQSSDKNQQQQYEITKQKNKSTQKKKSQNLLSSKQYQSLTNTQKLKKKRSQTSQVIDLHQANFKKKNTNNQQINELIQNDNQLKSKNTQESLQIIQNPNLSQDNIQNIKINLEDFLKDKYEQQKKEMQALNKDRLSLLLQKQNTQNNQKSKKLNNQNQSPFQKQNDKKMQQQSNLNHQETPETQKTQKKKKKRSLSMLNTQKFNSQNSQKPQINTLTPQNQKPQKIIQKQVSSAKHSNSHSKQTLLSFSKKHQNHHNHTQNNLNNLNIFKQSNQNNLIDNQTSNKHLLPTKNQQISKEKDKKKKKNSPASKTQPPQKQIFNTNSPIILKNYNLAQNLQNQNQFKKSQSPIKINNYIQQKQNIISNTNINNHSQINTKKQTSSSTQNYNNNNSNNNSNSQSSQGKKTSKNMLINQNYYINNNINNNSHNVNLVNQFKSKQSSSIASNPNYSLNDSKGCDTVSMYSLNSQNHQFK